MIDLLASAPSADGPALELDPVEVPGGTERRRPRLLLIDDEPFVARFLAHAAMDTGYDATVTISADNFRRAYELEEPDVIAIDLAMPGSDGVELLRFLAERKSEAIVLIVSGFDHRVLDSAMRFGEGLGLRMAGPLHKPLLVDHLKAAIAAAPPRAGR